MILRIKIDDDTYETYGAYNKKDPRKAIEKSLETFKAHDPRKKAIIFSGDDLAELQRLLTGSFDSPEGVLEALKSAVSAFVDDVCVELDAGQRKRLMLQAKAWKREPSEFIASQIIDNLRSL